MKGQQISKADRKRYLKKQFEYLAQSKGGLYIVHLQQKRMVDNVDFDDAGSRLIMDSVE